MSSPTVGDFLGTVYGSGTGYVHLSTLTSQITAVECAQVGTLADLIDGRTDVYLSAAVIGLEEGSGQGGRIVDGDASQLTTLWVELDRAGEPGHKTTGNLWTRGDVERLWEWLPILPTAVVDSGGGWWLYYTLTEPVPLNGDGTGELLLARWERWWSLIGEQFDRQVDSVFNPGRIVRAPGSINGKEGLARPAVLKSLDPGLLHTFDSLDSILPAPEAPRPSGGEVVGDGVRPGDVYNRDATVEGLVALLEFHGFHTPKHHPSGRVDLTRQGKNARDGHSVTVWPDAAVTFWSSAPEALPGTVTLKDRFGASGTYDPFGLYVAVEHGGDFKAAAKALNHDETKAAAADPTSLHPSDSNAYAHNTPSVDPVEPPELASDQDILTRFKRAAGMRGLVGEEGIAATIYLALTSRVLDKQVSIGLKGHSSSGKSFTVETVTKFFPPDAIIVMTGMSERALIYSKDDYRHRTLVVYEVVALREGQDDNLTSYFVRSLLSEGRIDYSVTVRDPRDGGFTTKTIVKEGPTNLIFTTTQTKVHAENETRVLSLTSDDSREQTGKVLAQLAEETDENVDLEPWQQLQTWLATTAERRVTIPYARTLAELLDPVAVRLRRDFSAVLALIRAHAILHQLNRERDATGRVVATLDDYDTVRDLVAHVIAEGVGSTVPLVVRETVAAVEALAPKNLDGVTVQALASHLNLDQSTISRRVRMSADGGWLRNLEDKRKKKGRWVVGDPMPGTADLLPHRRILETALDLGLCAYAPRSEGYIDPGETGENDSFGDAVDLLNEAGLLDPDDGYDAETDEIAP